MAELFGFTITRKKDEGGASFTLPTSDDGAEDIAQGGFFSSVYDIEGKDKCEWVLLDYVNVVVHIFQKSFREFFSIEELWGDAKILKIKESNLNE